MGLALAVSLAGCGARSDGTESPGASSSGGEAAAETPAVDVLPAPEPEDTPDDDGPAVITAVELTQQQAGEYETRGAALLGDRTGTYSSCFLVSFDRAVTDLTLWKIEADVRDDGTFVGRETERIGSVEKLERDEPVILAGELGELLPTLGISYGTGNGGTVHAYLAISGKDGSPMVVEYEAAGEEPAGQ